MKNWKVLLASLVTLFFGVLVIVFLFAYPFSRKIQLLKYGESLTHDSSVLCFTMSEDGNWIATGCRDSVVSLWEVSSKKKITDFKNHSDCIFEIAFSSDRSLLASASVIYGKDKSGWVGAQLRVLEVKSGKLVLSDDSFSSEITAMAFHPKMQFLVAAGGPEVEEENPFPKTKIHFYDLPKKKRDTLGEHQFSIISLSFNPSGNLLASGSREGEVRVWNARSGKQVKQIDNQNPSFLEFVGFTPDRLSLVTGHSDGEVAFWDLETFECKKEFRPHPFEVTCVAFSADGKWLLTGGTFKMEAPVYQGGEIKIWDWATGELLSTFEDFTGPIGQIAIDPDGTQIAYTIRHGDSVNFLKIQK